jgi:hypothetical protein
VLAAALSGDVGAVIVPESFGIHVHRSENIAAAKAVGFGSLRLWDSGTSWRDLEPRRGLLALAPLSYIVREARRAGLKPMLTLGSTPKWASVRPEEECAYGVGCAAEPRDVEAWRVYVRRVASGFRESIECFEPWNEVSFPREPGLAEGERGGSLGHFFSGSARDMVEISRATYQEVKAANAGACVLSPSFHSSGDWIEKLDRFLAVGGGRWFDVLSFHFYFGTEPEETIVGMKRVQETLSKYGLGQRRIWNTEVGIPFHLTAERIKAIGYDDLVYAMTLRTYLVNFGSGIERVYWYAWDNEQFGISGGTNNRGVGAQAIRASISLLRGTSRVACSDEQGLWTCDIKSGRGRQWVAWTTAKGPVGRVIRVGGGARRWGEDGESFRAGSEVVLDARPIVWRE